MAKLNLEYVTELNNYKDNSIENMLYNIVKEGRGIDDLKDDEITYSALYHLSKVRQNILVWYDFKEDARILEIGSECGAITGMLCQKGGFVTSLEVSRTQAMINYERNKHYDNLEIIVGNFEEINFNNAFDYIVISDLFEYIPQEVDSFKKFVDFLKKVSKLLSSNGCILLTVDNSLKDRCFFVADTDSKDNPCTAFSKTDVINICEYANLKCKKFYFPYPNSEFPSEIFTEKSINTNAYGKGFYQISEQGFAYVNEPESLKQLVKEGVADVFANSFLVEIVNSNQADKSRQAERNIQYVKLNADRNEEFQIYTVIYDKHGEKLVDKCALTEKSKEHLYRMHVFGTINHQGSWAAVLPQYNRDAGILTYPWIDAVSYDELVGQYVDENNLNGILNAIQFVKSTFLNEKKLTCPYQNEDFLSVFCGTKIKENSLAGYNSNENFECIEAGNIDIILSNIFNKDNNIFVIDYEWLFDFPIPVEYILWRIIRTLYSDHIRLSELIEQQNMERTFGISDEHVDLYNEWESNFVSQYVGVNSKLVNLAAIANYSSRKINSVMKLYIDQGDGFSENNTIERKVTVCDGNFEVAFPIESSHGWKQLRFDPADYACKISGLELLEDSHVLKIVPMNAYLFDGYDVFLWTDPNYLITKNDSEDTYLGEEVVIRGQLEILSQSMFEKYQIRVYSEYQSIEGKNRILELQVEDKERHINNQSNIIENQSNVIKNQSNVIENQSNVIENQNKAIEDLTKENQMFINELNAIKGSRLYKLYEIKDRIKNR